MAHQTEGRDRDYHKKVWLECDCSSKDHVACLQVDEWHWGDGDVDVRLYLDTQMRHHQSFFKRVWTAIKYVFSSTPCNFGYWNNMILRVPQAEQMIEVCKDYLKRCKKNKCFPQ